MKYFKLNLIQSLIILFLICVFSSCRHGDVMYVVDKQIYSEDFSGDMSAWVVEQTSEGTTILKEEALEINGGGCTVWFKEILSGPIMIEYDATLISEGGENDNCRDLNCFWMARHPRAPYDLFTGWRSNSSKRAGVFRNYDDLRCYYVGMGGNKNTTTRFRRYTGHGQRPLLPQHDLLGKNTLLEPNITYKIQVVACNNQIQFIRDGQVIFDFLDPHPYTSGWFGFRTVSNHIKFDNFKVFKLKSYNDINISPSEMDEAIKNATALELNKGLIQQSVRRGWRQQEFFRDDSVYLSERTVFSDPDTKAIIWRITNDPSIESNEYTDIPVFSADGKYILFVTRRNGMSERWLMNSDGTGLRPVGKTAEANFEKGYWSIKHPDIVYFSDTYTDGSRIRTRISSMNVRTGLTRLIAGADGDLGKMQPPDQSEELFLFADQMGGAYADKDHPSRSITINRQGEVFIAPFEKMVHRLRFTKSPDGRIFSNFDNPRRTFTSNYDGTDIHEMPFEGGHPDWVPGGKLLFYNARQLMPDGTVEFDVRYDAVDEYGMNLRTIYPYGGHASACLDGRYFVCDGGEGSGSVNYVALDERNTAQKLLYNQTSRYDHSNVWHPDHHSSHPHPNSSPDGTKVVSNSDALSEFSDMFVSISHFPDPPIDPSAFVSNGNCYLSWNKPERNKEIKGYHVYRSFTSGRDYFRLSEKLITDTTASFPVQGQLSYFVVTAIEHSGLESRPSQEIFQNGNNVWEGPVSISVEAESGNLKLPLEEKIDMSATSNGYFICSRDSVKNGSLTIKESVPVDGQYSLWVRIKGKGTWSLNNNSSTIGFVDFDSPDNWMWKRLNESVTLAKGVNEIEFEAQKGLEMLDKIIITNDPIFIPAGLMKLDNIAPQTPTEVSAYPVSSNTIKLVLGEPVDKDFSHFNIYGSFKKDFECDQSTILGSPAENIWLDWGLPLNRNCFYKVSIVDIAGNESMPSKLISAKPLQHKSERVDLLAEEALTENMESYDVQQNGLIALKLVEGKTGYAIWDFDIDNEGFYSIYGMSLLQRDLKTAFAIEIDGENRINWKVYGLFDTWKWSPAGKNYSGTPDLIYLNKGHHKIKIMPENSNSAFCKLTISNDPSWDPVDEMKSTGY